MPWNINLQVSRQICFLFNHINSLLNANPGIFNAWKRPDHTAGCVCVVCPAWRDLWDQMITDRRMRKRERMGGG